MTVLFVINPASGRGAPMKRMPEIEARCRDRNMACTVRRTDPSRPAGRIIRQCMGVVSGLNAVAVAGGDGTAAEAAAALVGTSLPLAIIPLGTGNDFARGLGLPGGNDLDACLDVVARGVRRPIDIARYRTDTETGVFLNVASAGFDAAATRAAAGLKKRISAPFVYLLGIFGALPALRFSDMTIEADGRRFRRKALMTAVANGRRYGGGIRINPEGCLEDGRMEMIIYGRTSPAMMAATLPRFLLGRHRSLTHVETLRCTSVRIASPRLLPVNIDGEVRESASLAVDIVPRGLTLLTPASLRRQCP